MLDADGAYRYFREVVNDLGGQLIQAGLITRRQLSQVRLSAPLHDGALVAALAEHGLSEDGLAGYFVAMGFGPLMEAADLAAADARATARVPGPMATGLMALPIRDSPAGLVVAMAAPTDAHAIHELSRAAGANVLPTVARVSDLAAAIERTHPDLPEEPEPARMDSEPPVLELVRPKIKVADGYFGSTKGAERVEARATVGAAIASDDTEAFVPLVRRKPVLPRADAPAKPGRRVITKSFAKLTRDDAPAVPVGGSSADRALRPPGTDGPKRRSRLDPATHGLLPNDTEVEPSPGLLGADTLVAITPGITPRPPKEEAPERAMPVAKARFPKPEDDAQPKRPKAKLKPETPKLRPKAKLKPETPRLRPKAKLKPEPEAPKPKVATGIAPGGKAETGGEAEHGEAAPIELRPRARKKKPAAKPKPRSIIPAEHERWGSLGSTDNKLGKRAAAAFRDSRPPRPASKPSEIGGTLSAIRASRDRDEVVNLACQGALSVSRATVLLALRKSVLKGWGGAGVGISDDAVRNLWIPTSSPSMFREVVAKKEVYHGPSGTAAADGLFRAALGSRGGPVSLHPILIGTKLVAVLAADDMRFADQGRERIETLGRAVSDAFERIIVERRRR